MISIATLFQLILVFIFPTSALYNFSCGCVQYYWDGIRCYANPCATAAINSSFVLLASAVFPGLVDNDLQLQAQISNLSAMITGQSTTNQSNSNA